MYESLTDETSSIGTRLIISVLIIQGLPNALGVKEDGFKLTVNERVQGAVYFLYRLCLLRLYKFFVILALVLENALHPKRALMAI
jgi:hypothetical protein